MSPWRRVVVVLVLIPLAVAPMGVAGQTQGHSASSGVTYLTDSGVTITLTDDRTVATQPFASTTSWQDDTLTVSGTNAGVSVSDSSYTSSSVTVSDVDIQGGSLTVERSNLNQTLVVTNGDAATIDLRDYQVGNGVSDLSYSSAGGVTVELAFASSKNITAVDGSGATLDNSTGATATLQLPAGTNTVTLQSRTTSQPAQLTAPVLASHYYVVIALAGALTAAWLYRPEDRTQITAFGAFLLWSLAAVLGGEVTVLDESTETVVGNVSAGTAVAVEGSSQFVAAPMPPAVRWLFAGFGVLSALAGVLYIVGVYPPTTDEPMTQQPADDDGRGVEA